MTRIPFILLSTTDGSPLTGAAPSVTISKDGGAFTSATNSPAEIGNGYYYVDLTGTEMSVTNNVIIRATATGAQPTAVVWEPEQAIPTASDNATAVWGASSRTLTNLNIQSELTTYGAAKTSDIPDVSSIQSGLATSSDLSAVASNVSAVKTKTDNLPQSPAATGGEMALTSAAVSAVRSGLSTFNPANTAVIVNADQAATMRTATGFTTPEQLASATYDIVHAMPSTSGLATSADLTSATNSVLSLLNLVFSGIYHWTVNDTLLTVYNSSNVPIGAYTITKDASGAITAVTPIVTTTNAD